MAKNRPINPDSSQEQSMTTRIPFDEESAPTELVVGADQELETSAAMPVLPKENLLPRKKEIQLPLASPDGGPTELGILAGQVAAQILDLEKAMGDSVPVEDRTAEFDQRLNSLCQLRLLYQRLSTELLGLKGQLEASQTAHASTSEALAETKGALSQYCEKTRRLEAALQRAHAALEHSSRANSQAAKDLLEALELQIKVATPPLGAPNKPFGSTLPSIDAAKLQELKGVTLETLKKRQDAVAAGAITAAVPVVVGPKVLPDVPFIADVGVGIVLGAVVATLVAKFRKPR